MAQNPYDNPFSAAPPLSARPQPSGPVLRRYAPWIILAALPLLGCVGTIVYFVVDSWGRESVRVHPEVCSGQPVAGAVAYQQGPVPHKAGFFERTAAGTYASASDDLVPLRARALYVDAMQLAVCAEPPVEQLVERCTFANGRSFERRQTQRVLRVVTATTAQPVAQVTAVSETPPACSVLEAHYANDLSRAHVVAAVREYDAWRVLQPYIAP